MLDVIDRMFKDELPAWKAGLKRMLPSYGESIADDADLCRTIRAETADALHLRTPVVA
jgi:malate dehydrogenase (quinone)